MGSLQHPIIEPHLKESSFNVPTVPYPAVSTVAIPSDLSEINSVTFQAVDSLNSILKNNDYALIRSLFLTESCYWKDHLGLTSTRFITLNGADEITSFISSNCSAEGKCVIQSFAVEKKKEPLVTNLDPGGTIKCIQAFIVFETEHSRGRGVMTLLRDVKDGDQWKIFTLFTCLYELKAYPWKGSEGRELYGMPDGVDGRINWADWRAQKQNFGKESPAVLVVGAGHSSLMTAARLGMLGISTLVIEKSERVGDSWRKRYHNLMLHDPCWMNAMPYLAYPANWPIYASKDRMADFLEYYATALELNVWTRAEVAESKWDKCEKRWTVVLERMVDGIKERRTLHPRHVIQATGLNGEPRIPIIPGMHTFVGPSCHSSEIKTGTLQHAGKKVVIVGTGCSAHDIADELHRNGAHVTFIQRSPTYVISLASTLAMMKTRYDEGKITEDSDLLSASTPTMVAQRVGSDAARLFGKRDRELLDGLKAAGFNLDESFPSPANLTIHRAGGFYIDTGTSSLISSGAIKVKNASQITQIKPRSLILANSNGGEEIEVDEIVFATGYENGRVRTRKVFGDEVADNIDPIWGYNEMGEIRGVFRRSGHEGFWVAAGSFWLSRYYSRLLALQIKMVEEGLVGL